jgi:hypothetical protein
LVIPEINLDACQAHKGIIANPNCSTIIAITPLWHSKVNPIRRLIAATYQSLRARGCDGGVGGIHARLSRRPSVRAKILPHPYAFNLFSHNSKVGPNGYNEEETKMVKETKKIFADPDIRVSATCVRVPVLRAHSEALNIECERPITPAEVSALMASAPGVKIVDDVEKNYFPMPKDASGKTTFWWAASPIRAILLANPSRCSSQGTTIEGRRTQCRADSRGIGGARLGTRRMIVMKFGGTSVESAEAIRRVAGIVRARLDRHPVVVVSAMGKTTNRLLAIATAAVASDLDRALILLGELRDFHLREASGVGGAIQEHFAELEALVRGLAVMGELTPRATDAIPRWASGLASQLQRSFAAKAWTRRMSIRAALL